VEVHAAKGETPENVDLMAINLSLDWLVVLNRDVSACFPGDDFLKDSLNRDFVGDARILFASRLLFLCHRRAFFLSVPACRYAFARSTTALPEPPSMASPPGRLALAVQLRCHGLQPFDNVAGRDIMPTPGNMMLAPIISRWRRLRES